MAVKRYLDLRPEEWQVLLARVAAALKACDTAEVSRIAFSIDMTYNGLKKRHLAGMTLVSKHGPGSGSSGSLTTCSGRRTWAIPSTAWRWHAWLRK